MPRGFAAPALAAPAARSVAGVRRTRAPLTTRERASSFRGRSASRNRPSSSGREPPPTAEEARHDLRGDAGVEPDELIAFCKQRMAAYKYPRQIEIMSELPKTVTGKLLRRELRDREESEAPSGSI